MNSVTISSKFQVVIPRNVRKSLKLKPGQKLRVIQYGKRIELIPEISVSEMRGFLIGIKTDFNREGDRV